ncbi:threonine synthase [Saliphagus infecundisoli]|uniref:Pyridoxal-phosphate dependent enzyme n=1 Tax=Saliphagus infecundisoli TaxID=1849069 RepID=A0ABD5QKX7_9EURY|nr:pyridoxal-phosphate dependent enzyme [Saliphagus infecundisoli]
METTEAFSGLACLDCGEEVGPEAGRCPACGGVLDPRYDYDAIGVEPAALDSRRTNGQWRYEDLLPLPRERAVTADEGGTPLVDCGKLADELGIERVFVKDEGRNPSGSIADRGAYLGASMAREAGVEAVGLASTGTDGQAVAAAAGRADLAANVFVPARSGFTAKAMTNVHGGEMTVAGGRIREAEEAYADASEGEEWYPMGAFETPYRHEGVKTVAYEIAESLEWESPDAVVVPTGDGAGVVGIEKGFRELVELDFVDRVPSIYAAQASGCAPIAEAVATGADEPEPVEHPDTICGDIEIPDPTAGAHVIDALSRSGGGGVATDDEEILEAAIAVAKGEGLEFSPSAASAASGAWELAEQGTWNGDETVVIVNTASANKEADVLRSHLMGKGI